MFFYLYFVSNLLYAASVDNRDLIRSSIDEGANINYIDNGPIIPPGKQSNKQKQKSMSLNMHVEMTNIIYLYIHCFFVLFLIRCL
jgi:hypothetical protein